MQMDVMKVTGHVQAADTAPAALAFRVHHSQRTIPMQREQPEGWARASYNYLVPSELAM